MKSQRTWVLIADATRARVLESEGPGHGLKLVSGLSFEVALPPTHELVSDRQARSYESVGSARHAISGRTDPRRKEKRRFVEDVADAVAKLGSQKAFDRLIIVAPPQALGDLRDALPESIRGLIVTEVAKDLTKTPDSEVAGHLDLAVPL